ncbi:hypothetical protein AHAS_Ahas05G0152200 [Arachis hypogaea]
MGVPLEHQGVARQLEINTGACHLGPMHGTPMMKKDEHQHWAWHATCWAWHANNVFQRREMVHTMDVARQLLGVQRQFIFPKKKSKKKSLGVPLRLGDMARQTKQG